MILILVTYTTLCDMLILNVVMSLGQNAVHNKLVELLFGCKT